MCTSDLETYYEEENYKGIEKINGNNNSSQILNKKRKRIKKNKKSVDYLNEYEEINSNNLFNNNEDDKINEYIINNNKEINFNNYLYVGCDDGTVKIIEINNDSFIKRLFN